MLLLVVILGMIFSTSCKNVEQAKETREQSTRQPDSVLGRWYECLDGGIYIWEFKDNGYYYREEEESFGAKRGQGKYTIDGKNVELNKRKANIEYTDYGIYIEYEEGDKEVRLYESRIEALESDVQGRQSDVYYETLKDENGYVIEDGVMLRYFTNAKEIAIPDNVTELGPLLIVSELETINKVIIPGNVKRIGKAAFLETAVNYFIIEEGVEEIGECAFEDSYWDEVYIPDSVKKIEEFAFRCSEGNPRGKIYVKKGSYAEKHFAENSTTYDGKVIVEE